MKYDIHLCTTVRVKVSGVEADSITEALAKAQASIDLHEVLDNTRPNADNVESVFWDEDAISFALVNRINADGEVDYEKTQFIDGDGNPLVDNKTPAERKAAAADGASLFMEELLNSVETLTNIAEEHGTRTLVDIMYLQAAIIDGGFIDQHCSESAVAKIVAGLPSGERWTKFVKKDYMAQPQTVGA